jgi:YggT family protein
VFALRHLVQALATVIDIALVLYMIALLVAVAVSWFAPRSRHPAIAFVRRIVDPSLRRIRRAMPFLVQAGLDLTPIVLFLIIYFLRKFVVATLYEAATRIG